jgi:hypothetical protein
VGGEKVLNACPQQAHRYKKTLLKKKLEKMKPSKRVLLLQV